MPGFLRTRMFLHVDGFFTHFFTTIPLWLKPVNRFNATKVAIDLSPCLKVRGLRLVSGSLVFSHWSLVYIHLFPITHYQLPNYAASVTFKSLRALISTLIEGPIVAET